MQVAILKTDLFQPIYKKIQKQLVLMAILIAGFGMNGFAQPGNDDPCNAIPLTPAAVCNFQVFGNEGSTPATGVPDPDCGFFQGTEGDVWFQVTVPAASNGILKFSTQEGGMTDGVMAIYSGTDCANLTEVDCNDDNPNPFSTMPQLTLSNLTIGSTLWIRIWSYSGDGDGTFGICVKYPGPPPSYDEPCTATALPTPTTDCNYLTFTDDGATASANVPAPGCANYQGGDVWFTVTVPAGGILKFDTQEGEVFDGGMAIYSGTCDNLSLIACDANSSQNGQMPQILATNLTPGSTVWIRFWTQGSNGSLGTFGICASIPPPPPVNDDPCGAISITATANCNFQTFSTASASGTSGVPDPDCFGYEGGDVWFKVVVPCEGRLFFDTEEGDIFDGGMAVYSGTDCNNLTELDCNDDGPNGTMPQISLDNLTEGSTVWIRFWEYGNDQSGTFGLCVTVPPPPGPGGSCSTAQPFCSSDTYTFPNSTNVPSLGEGGIYGCLGSTPNPFWYYMQMQTPGSIDILIQQTTPDGQDLLDVDYALWGPFPSLAASCGNLSEDNNISCSYSVDGVETASIANGQAGDFYILLVTNYSDEPGIITFHQTAGTGSTSCDIICTLSSSNSGPVCPGALFDLSASSVANATYLWTGPNCFTSVLQNPTGITASTIPGTYVYTVTATTPSGTQCTSRDTVIVLARPALGLDSSINICSGTSLDLTTLYTTTGLTTAWTTNPGAVAVPVPTAVNVSNIYQLIGTNAGGCKDTALVTLVVDTVRSAVSPANGTCTLPGTITITNPTGIGNVFDYNIDTNPGVFQPGNIFTADPGSYTITTRDSIGCVTSAPVTVSFINDLTLNVTPQVDTVCLNQPITLHANSSATVYSWTPVTGLNDASSASPVATPANDVVYTVVATLGSCQLTGSVKLHVDKSLHVEAGGPLFIDGGSNGQVLAVVTGNTGNLSGILWTPSTGLNSSTILNPVVTPAITSGVATYQITVTNSNGCTASDILVVNVIPNCRNIRNAFTPNGDGNNDLWLVYDSYACLKNVSVHVFNRYGAKVFESKDYRNDWDGRYKGKSLPDGTYYAVVDFTLLSGRVISEKTDLTILR